MRVFLATILPIAFFGQMQQRKEPPPIPIEERDNVDLSLQILAWTANVDGTAVAVRETFPTATLAQKEVLELDGKWQPGFRLAAGYHLGFFDQWDILATWTYYHGSSDHIIRSVSTDDLTFPDGWLRQGWSPFLGPIVTSANGHWNLNLNLIDVELGRTYKITQQIAMRPHAGARGAVSNLNYLAHYNGMWTLQLFTTGGEVGENFFFHPTTFKADSNLGAGGLVAGTALRWNFNKNWAFFGDLAASLLYGHFSVKENFDGAGYEELIAPDDIIGLIRINEKYKDAFNRVRATFDFLFGLEARTMFNKDRSRVTFFLGYELMKLFRFNELFQVNRSIDSRVLVDVIDFGESESLLVTTADTTFELINKSNDIGLQGITTKIEFEF